MPKIQISHAKQLTLAILFAALLWILEFPVATAIAELLFGSPSNYKDFNFLIIDAIVSFIVLCVYFFVILHFKKTYSRFIVWFCAVAMFLYWGFESDFFFEGLNPMYAAWYEINMALNDIVAAALTIFSTNRIARKSKD